MKQPQDEIFRELEILLEQEYSGKTCLFRSIKTSPNSAFVDTHSIVTQYSIFMRKVLKKL
jgi:hypothetical protein